MKTRTKFLASLLIVSMLAGNFSGYAAMPQVMNVQAETPAPTIPTVLGTELFVEDFNGATHSLSGTNEGCTVTLQDGSLVIEKNKVANFYREALFQTTSTETAAMVQVKFRLDDPTTRFRITGYFGSTSNAKTVHIKDGMMYHADNDTSTVALSASTWHTLTVLADYENNTAYYYLDGVCFYQFTDAAIVSQNSQLYSLRLTRNKTSDANLACAIRFDEIKAYGVTLGAVSPTEAPTVAPTEVPTPAPTEAPTVAPTETPTVAPTAVPTATPVPTIEAPSIPTTYGTELFVETFNGTAHSLEGTNTGCTETLQDGYLLLGNAENGKAFDRKGIFTQQVLESATLIQTKFSLSDIDTQFRFMVYLQNGTSVYEQLRISDGKIYRNGEEDTAYATLTANTMHTLSVLADYASNTIYYYLDGVCFTKYTDAEKVSQTQQLGGINLFRTKAMNAAGGAACAIAFDEVKAYGVAGSGPSATPAPTAAPTPAPTPAPTLMPDQGSYVFEERFENDTYGDGFQVVGSGWTRSLMSGYTLFEKANAAQAYFDVIPTTIQNGTKAVYATDFYLEDVNSPFRVMFFTAADPSSTLDTINIYDGKLVWHGYTKDLEANKWYTLSAFFNYEAGTVDFYLNGEHFGSVKDTAAISMASQLTKVRVNFADKINGIEGNFQKNFAVRYDNVLVYDEGVGAVVPTPTPQPTIPPQLEGTLYFEETFPGEDYKSNKHLKLTSGWTKTVKDGYILCEKIDGKSAYMEGNFGAIPKGNTAVFQTDFYLEDLDSPFRIILYTVGAGEVETLDSVYVVDGRLTRSLKKMQLEAEKWYTFTAVFNYSNGTVDYFLNDEFFAQYVNPDRISLNSQFCKMRFNYGDKMNGVTGYLEKNFKVRFDNVRIYEADLGPARLGGSGYPALPTNVTAPLEGERYMVYEDFADDKLNKALKFVGKGWTRTLHQDGYMHLQKEEAVQAYMNVSVPAINIGNSVVFKTDFFMEYQDSAFRLIFSTIDGEAYNAFDSLYVYNGGVIYSVNKFDLEPNTWHTITAYVNYDKSTIYYYLDDQIVGFKTDTEKINYEHQLRQVRIAYADKVGKLKNNFKRHFQVRLDNIKVYNGNAAEPYYPYFGNKVLVNETFDTDGWQITSLSDKGWLKSLQQEKNGKDRKSVV